MINNGVWSERISWKSKKLHGKKTYSCHCCDWLPVWSRGSGHWTSTGRCGLLGMLTGGRAFLIGLKPRGDEPGEWAGERWAGRSGGTARGCGRRGCASGEALRGYLRGADHTGRSLLLEEEREEAGLGSIGGAYRAGILSSDWMAALPPVHSSKCSRVSWKKMKNTSLLDESLNKNRLSLQRHLNGTYSCTYLCNYLWYYF